MRISLNPPSTRLASLTVFASASLWGVYWIPLRYLESEGIHGSWAIAFLNLPAAVILIAVLATRWKQQTKYFKQVFAIGILTGLGLALYASGLIYSSVVRATLFFYLTPVWSTLIGTFWLGERASWQRWLAITIGLCGLVFMVSGGNTVPLNIGDLFALFSGLFWAFGAAMIKRFDQVPVASMTMVQFAVAGLGALMLGYFAGGIQVPEPTSIIHVIPVAFPISALVLLPGIMMVFWAQKFLFPGRVGLLMMSEVMVAVLSASLLLPEERMSAIEWAGAVLIISACLLEVLITPHGQGELSQDLT